MPKVDPKKIGWSSYLSFEGAFYPGSQKYVEPANPSWNDHLLTTITATEGGRYDAFNGYDVCISTSGLIQWCERAQFSVSDMLGVVAERGLPDIKQLDEALAASNAVFKKNARGRWRFHFLDERGEVDREDEQKQLFLLNSNGSRGSWDDESKAHAKLWAASISSVWTSPEAIQAQIDFTVPRLQWFVTKEARAILMGPGTPTENEGWVGAVRAGFISFAANIPVVAGKMIQQAVKETTAEPFSPDWCIAILKQCTFGPKIAIYPHRYKAIRPVLERLFGVDLPDFAADLQAWKGEVLTPPVDPVPSLTLANFDEPIEYQKELVAEGYDLGPAGADGVFGKKSKAALIQFQQLHGLVPDGIIGPKTRQAFLSEALKRAA